MAISTAVEAPGAPRAPAPAARAEIVAASSASRVGETGGGVGRQGHVDQAGVAEVDVGVVAGGIGGGGDGGHEGGTGLERPGLEGGLDTGQEDPPVGEVGAPIELRRCQSLDHAVTLGGRDPVPIRARRPGVTSRTGPARRGQEAMRHLARLLTRIFFRRIEVAGAEQLPGGPVVLVANHVNGLVDGMVLLASLERYPRFLGKSTLFKILPLAPFLRLAGVVPVYRASDGSTERNREAFVTAGAILSGGAMVAVFPEGVSHDDARLHPLRTGAARIALAAVDQGVTGLAVVPVGLVYEEKARFRSRALVRIGTPFAAAGYPPGGGADAVRALTARIADALAAVAPMYGSRQDELLFQQAAALVCRTDDPTALAGRDAVARRLALGPPDAVGTLRAATERYEEHLGALGLADAQVAGLSPPRYRRRRLARVGLLAAAAPVAMVGAAVHAVPYGVMKQVGKRPSNEGMRATVKLLGCFGLFTLTYIAIGIAVGRRRGPVAGAAAFVAAPWSGYVTVRVAEEIAHAGGMVRARAVLAGDGGTVSDLQAARAAVVTAAQNVLAPPPPAS